jgi:hypothetical protein
MTEKKRVVDEIQSGQESPDCDASQLPFYWRDLSILSTALALAAWPPMGGEGNVLSRPFTSSLLTPRGRRHRRRLGLEQCFWNCRVAPVRQL